MTSQRLELDYTALQRRWHHEQQKLRRLVAYVNTRQCRRRHLLAYFGEPWEQPNCAACDRCLDDHAFVTAPPSPKRDLHEAEWLLVQKILSCVARMQGRYGRAKVIQVLMGSRAREIRESPLSRLSTYGILQGTPRPLLDAYMDALLEADCVRIVGEEFPKLELTTQGWSVMRRQQSVQLAMPGSGTVAAFQEPRQARALRSALRAEPSPVTIPSLSPEVVTPVTPVRSEIHRATPSALQVSEPDAGLLERLRVQRTALARAEAIPPYCVFNDRTLHEMAVQLPADRASLLQIHGVGEAKANKYGDIFLDLIREHTPARH